MFNVKELVGSKKFKVMLFTVLGLVCGVFADSLTVAQALESGVMVIMTYIGAQGVADFGKAKGASSDE